MKTKIVSYFIYPVKSTRGSEQAQITFNEHGLLGDRNFAWIDQNDKVITARQIPRLVTVAATVDSTAISFLSGADQAQFFFEDLKRVSEHPVSYFGRAKKVILLNSKILEEWTLLHFGQKLRLVKAISLLTETNPSNFVDSSPILLINKNSFEKLNMSSENSSLAAFRGNIIIEDQAWAEKKWQSVKIGSVQFKVVGECPRCSMVGIDPASGQFNSEIPKVLKNALVNDFNFGMYLQPLNSGVINHESIIVLTGK